MPSPPRIASIPSKNARFTSGMNRMPKTASSPNGANGSTCDADAECTSTHCYEATFGNGTCTSGAVGQLCAENLDCVDGHCPVPMAGSRVCTSGAQGQTCQDNSHCASNDCNTNNNQCRN